jgi:hypothetical protein
MFEISYYKIFVNFLLLGFDKKKIMYREFESTVLRSNNRGESYSTSNLKSHG